jgi:hypothetical protein
MDTKKDKEPKGSAATASKMAASKKQVGDESPSPGQGATSSQNQGGTQNQGATGTQNQNASITPQQHHGEVGAPPHPGGTGSQQNLGQDLQDFSRRTRSLVNHEKSCESCPTAVLRITSGLRLGR